MTDYLCSKILLRLLTQYSKIFDADIWTQTLSPERLVMTPGEDITDANFGNFEHGDVSGYKFNDLNGNGEHDDDEPKLQGWTIELYNDNDDEDNLLK